MPKDIQTVIAELKSIEKVNYEAEVRKAYKPGEKIYRRGDNTLMGIHVQIEGEVFSEYTDQFEKPASITEAQLREIVYRTIYLHKILNKV